MPIDLPIRKGCMLVVLDKNSILREFHFPHVGQENHTGQPVVLRNPLEKNFVGE